MCTTVGDTLLVAEMPAVRQKAVAGAPTNLLILSGTANPELAKEVADYLELSVAPVKISPFSDGEIYVQVQDSVRGQDCFVVQPTCTPVNENLMELLILLDALKRASAGRITVVMPYYGYARQDKKLKPREPVTARLVADSVSYTHLTLPTILRV